MDQLIRGGESCGTPGYPVGRLTQIWAPPEAGLQILALQSIRAAAMERDVLVLDWSGAFPDGELSLGNVTYAKPTDLAEGLNVAAVHLAKGSELALFMYRPDLARFKRGEPEDLEGRLEPEIRRSMGNSAGWTRYISPLKRVCGKRGCPAVAFFQTPSRHPRPISTAWQFYASLRICLEPSEVGWEARIIKSMVSRAHGDVGSVVIP